jgi:hypothetical protein
MAKLARVARRPVNGNQPASITFNSSGGMLTSGNSHAAHPASARRARPRVNPAAATRATVGALHRHNAATSKRRPWRKQASTLAAPTLAKAGRFATKNTSRSSE